MLCALCWCRPALACGGFFCSRTPVDQTAERIIFEVNDDDTITAYVQIQYAGERDDFAWVVPVPSVPVLDTFPRLAFQALDVATQPAFRTSCGRELLQGGSQLARSSGVIVYNEQAVGPFDTATLGGDSALELVTWLQDNGYRVSDAMVPFINFYVRNGMLFLAMKLSPDADVSDIEPVAMTYTGSEPMIPLRLTAVAARPELGVLAFVLADRRYGPKNYAEVTISDELLRFDEFGSRNNYLTLVSREIDQHGGHAFVTEYAGATSELVAQFQNAFVPDNDDAREANAALIELLQRHAYITRLYTRISPEEMTIDPVFVPASSQVDVDNVRDASGAGDPCASPPSCSFTYCGPAGRCLPADAGTDGCYCDVDASAMLTPTFGSQPAVYCEPVSTDVLGTPDTGADSSPCSSYDCGEGSCTLINGNPTCQCTPGHLAVVQATPSASGTSSSQVRCVSQAPSGPLAGGPPTSVDTGGTGSPAGTGGTMGSATAGTGVADAGLRSTVRVQLASTHGGCDCALGHAPQSRGPLYVGLLGLAFALRRRARVRRRR